MTDLNANEINDDIDDCDCDPSNTVPYRVVEGDTLFKISKEHNVRMRCLLKLNSLANRNFIRVGQIINLPA
jgi:LysM repeat protein